MTFVEGVPPSKHFRCITQRHVLRSPITQPNIPGEQVAYRQFPRPSPLPRRRGSARLPAAFKKQLCLARPRKRGRPDTIRVSPCYVFTSARELLTAIEREPS